MLRIVTAIIAVLPGRISVSPQLALTSHAGAAAAGLAGASTKAATSISPAIRPGARLERRPGGVAVRVCIVIVSLPISASPMPVGRMASGPGTSAFFLLFLFLVLLVAFVFLPFAPVRRRVVLAAEFFGALGFEVGRRQ